MSDDAMILLRDGPFANTFRKTDGPAPEWYVAGHIAPRLRGPGDGRGRGGERIVYRRTNVLTVEGVPIYDYVGEPIDAAR